MYKKELKKYLNNSYYVYKNNYIVNKLCWLNQHKDNCLYDVVTIY